MRHTIGVSEVSPQLPRLAKIQVWGCKIRAIPIWRLFEHVFQLASPRLQVITHTLNLGAPLLVGAADSGRAARRRLSRRDAYWPEAWRGLASEAMYEALGWHTE